jgi:hypothetical protein
MRQQVVDLVDEYAPKVMVTTVRHRERDRVAGLEVDAAEVQSGLVGHDRRGSGCQVGAPHLV